MDQRTSFSGSSCSSIWSIFNPSCWGNSSGSQGAGGSGLDKPTPGASQGQCYCDAQCQQYNDCCASCKQAPNSSSGEPGYGSQGSQGQCYCDTLCQQYNDCCASCKEPNPSSSSTCKMMGITVQKGTCIGCHMGDGFWPSICVGSDQWAPGPGTLNDRLGGCLHYYQTCGGTYAKQW